MKYLLEDLCKNFFPKFDIDLKGNSLSLIAKKNEQITIYLYHDLKLEFAQRGDRHYYV